MSILLCFQQMDFSAVSNATAEQLQEFGVVKRGDLLSLKGFVSEKLKGETRDEKKRKLLSMLQEKSEQKKLLQTHIHNMFSFFHNYYS